MSKTLPHQLGMTLGTLFGLLHLLWSVIVALGWAERLAGSAMRLHFMSHSHEFMPFDVGTAILLIIVTAVIGYVIGFVAGKLFVAYSK